MARSVKRLSPSVFVLILVCFLMPFMDLSCSGQKIATLNGIDLVTGKTLEEPGMGAQIDQDEARIDPEGWAVVAFAAAVVGLLLSFLRGFRTAFAPAVTAGAGFLATLLLKFDIDNDITSQGEGLITVEYRIGYWLVLLLFLAAAALNFYLATQKEMASAALTTEDTDTS